MKRRIHHDKRRGVVGTSQGLLRRLLTRRADECRLEGLSRLLPHGHAILGASSNTVLLHGLHLQHKTRSRLSRLSRLCRLCRLNGLSRLNRLSRLGFSRLWGLLYAATPVQSLPLFGSLRRGSRGLDGCGSRRDDTRLRLHGGVLRSTGLPIDLGLGINRVITRTIRSCRGNNSSGVLRSGACPLRMDSRRSRYRFSSIVRVFVLLLHLLEVRMGRRRNVRLASAGDFLPSVVRGLAYT